MNEMFAQGDLLIEPATPPSLDRVKIAPLQLWNPARTNYLTLT
jgi:hypothetical protein